MLNTKLPKFHYKKGTLDAANFVYPNLDDNFDGAPVPIRIGDLHNIVPVCIDTSATKTYKLAGHAIHAINAVRSGTEILTPIIDYSTVLAKAEFTVAATPFLAAGTTYYFVLDLDLLVDPNKHMHLKRYDDAVCGYGDGQLFSIDDGGVWTADAGHDLRFWIYGRETLDGPETIQVNNSRGIWPNETQEFKDTAATTRIGQSFKTGATAFYCTRIQVWCRKWPWDDTWTAGNIRVSVLSTAPVPGSDPPLPAEVQIGCTSLDASADNYGDPFLFPLRSEVSSLSCDIEGAEITGTTAHRAISGNVATIGTAAAHGLIVGSNVVISGMADATYNGTFAVTVVPDIIHFSYALTHADEGETVDTGGTWTGAIVTVAETLKYLIQTVLGKPATLLDATYLADLATDRTQAVKLNIDYETDIGAIIGELETGQLWKLVPLLDGTYGTVVYEDLEPANTPHFRDEDYLSFRMWLDYSAVKSKVVVKYDKGADQTNDYKAEQVSSDLARFFYLNEETLEVETFLAESAGAAWLAGELGGMYEQPPLMVEFEVHGWGMDLIPGRDKVKLTRTRAMYASGKLDAVLFRILRLQKRPGTSTVVITAILDTQSY